MSRRAEALGLLLAAVLGGCSAPQEPAPGPWSAPEGWSADTPALEACPAGERDERPEVEVYARGLEIPWDMAFLPDGRLLVVERAGRVRVVEDGGELRPEPWATLQVQAVAEAGLLGIAADPDFETNGHVYLLGTFVETSLGARIGRGLRGIFDAAAANAWRNRLIRLTDAGGRGERPEVLVDGVPAGPIHAGGSLRFSPDGSLFFGVGEGSVPARASDSTSGGGKLHRVAIGPGGVEHEIVARGLRNPQAIAVDPLTGRLLVTDHGPSGLPSEGFRSGHDELNWLAPGADYGWPEVAGRWTGAPGFAPVMDWTPAIAPGGVTFVDDSTSSWHGDVIVGSLVQGRLLRLSLDRRADPPLPVCQTPLFALEYGRLRAVQHGPDGWVYFTTSNRDQRGVAREGDDRILRFRPPRRNGPGGSSQ